MPSTRTLGVLDVDVIEHEVERKERLHGERLHTRT